MNATRKQAIEELRRMVLAALGDYDAAVWLFGSCARGEPRQHSDIDIAILPRDDLGLGLLAELEAAIVDQRRSTWRRSTKSTSWGIVLSSKYRSTAGSQCSAQ
jgi:predicted nucleotidyltransferase